MGLAETSTQVAFTCSKEDRETWTEEAVEYGYRSRSQYLYILIQEARAYRKHGVFADRSSEERIEELEAQVESMKQKLEQEQGEPRIRREIDDPEYLELFLDETYKTLPELLQEVIESGAMDGLIRDRIESELYVMAGLEKVEYEPRWGWKLADSNNE